MKQTTEVSKMIDFDMVCMSFGKEKERGLKVVQGAEKNSIFDEGMMINAEDGELKENDTLKLANGNIIKFEERAFKILKNNRKQKEEKGIVLNYQKEAERVRNRKTKKDIDNTETGKSHREARESRDAI